MILGIQQDLKSEGIKVTISHAAALPANMLKRSAVWRSFWIFIVTSQTKRPFGTDLEWPAAGNRKIGEKSQ